MNDDQKKIIVVNRIFEETGQTNSTGEPITPVNRWLAYLIVVPVLIIMIIIGAFFFAAFLALFAIAAVGFGIRIWWIRRKLRKQMNTSGEDYIIIEDGEVVESDDNHSPKQKEQPYK